MGGTSGRARTDEHWLGDGDHGRTDRRAFAVLLVLAGLAVAAFALVHRQGMAHSSGAGDACPVTASGALVGIDAATGEVRWSTIVPAGAQLDVEEGDGPHIQAHTVREAPHEPAGTIDVTHRTIDPDDGRVTGCTADRIAPSEDQASTLAADPRPTSRPIQLDGLTIMDWGDGLRATDAAGTGIWGTHRTHAISHLGDTLLVQALHGEEHVVALLDLRTGDEVWSASELLANTPQDGEPVLTRSKGDHLAVTARDAATGAVLWQSRLPAGFGTQPLQVAGDLVLVAGLDGAEVAALDRATGELRWTADGGSPGQNRFHTEPGTIHDLVRSPDGQTVVVAIDAVREWFD